MCIYIESCFGPCLVVYRPSSAPFSLVRILEAPSSSWEAFDSDSLFASMRASFYLSPKFFGNLSLWLWLIRSWLSSSFSISVFCLIFGGGLEGHFWGGLAASGPFVPHGGQGALVPRTPACYWIVSHFYPPIELFRPAFNIFCLIFLA